jgi:hypothetical protein
MRAEPIQGTTLSGSYSEGNWLGGVSSFLRLRRKTPDWGELIFSTLEFGSESDNE